MGTDLVRAAAPLLLWAVVLTGAAVAAEPGSVTVCDTLLSARRVDATPITDRDAAPEAGCRRIPRGDVGGVEQRALIGGVPYECLTVAGTGGCAWVVP